MATKLEQLKSRLDKEAQKIEDIKKSIETEELAELQAEEFAAKLVNVQEQIAGSVKAILDGEGIALPEGKSVTLTSTATGEFTVSVLAQKPKKAGGGTGTGTRATVEVPSGLDRMGDLQGKKASWSQIADTAGISYGSGSAHKAVFTQDKALHDSIPHENCPYV